MVFHLVLISLVMVNSVGCTRGQWVHLDRSPEQVLQDFLECETLSSLRPPPATLAEKRTANPDTTSADIQKCMRGKGYHWSADPGSSP